MLEVLNETDGKGDSAEAQKLKSPQPHAPGRRPRFYLAVLTERLTSAPRYDISLRRNRASNVSPHAILVARWLGGCVGQRPLNRRAPVANSALDHRPE
jgi:hypothetical protein